MTSAIEATGATSGVFQYVALFRPGDSSGTASSRVGSFIVDPVSLSPAARRIAGLVGGLSQVSDAQASRASFGEQLQRRVQAILAARGSAATAADDGGTQVSDGGSSGASGSNRLGGGSTAATPQDGGGGTTGSIPTAAQTQA